MSAKKKKGKGKARTSNKRANPRPKLSDTQRSAGEALGKMLSDAVSRKMNSSGISNPLLRPEVREASRPANSISVRTPDSQQITWGFHSEDSFNSKSVPVQATWKWFPNEQRFADVNVTATADFAEGVYTVSLGGVAILHPNARLKGTSEDAKKLAEALLSASDWERSHILVMTTDFNSEGWKDY